MKLSEDSYTAEFSCLNKGQELDDYSIKIKTNQTYGTLVMLFILTYVI